MIDNAAKDAMKGLEDQMTNLFLRVGVLEGAITTMQAKVDR